MADFTPDPAFAPDMPDKKASWQDVVSSLPGRAVESAKKTGRVALGIDDPKGITDIALQTMTTAPAVGAGGALAAARGLPAWLGRILTSGGIGAGQAAARGESVARGAGRDTLAAAAFEALPGLARVTRIPWTKLSLKEAGGAAREYDRVTKLPEQAMTYLQPYIPSGWGKWLQVPSLGNTPMALDEAMKALSKLKDASYQAARMEIHNNLKSVEKVTGPMPAKLFEELTAPARFAPPRGSRIAEHAREQSLTSPELRSGLDALSAVDVKGVPLGLIPGAAMGENLGDIVSRFRR